MRRRFLRIFPSASHSLIPEIFREGRNTSISCHWRTLALFISLLTLIAADCCFSFAQDSEGSISSGYKQTESEASGHLPDASSQKTSEEELYQENEWNFVDGSMDISEGIPADAVGRLANIREAGKLVVCTEPYFAPQEFIDPDLEGQDQYAGADMELARRVAERMGVELEIVPLEFTDVLTSIGSGKYDLAISGLSYTPGRASSMELSKGYHYSTEAAAVGLVIRESDASALQELPDLAGRNLAAQAGSLQELLVAQNINDYRQFVRLGSIQDVYDEVSEGRADAAGVDIESARLYIRNNPDCGLTLMQGVSFRLEEQLEGDRIAGPKDEIELMYFVNGVIDEILESGEYEEWFAEASERAAELGL